MRHIKLIDIDTRNGWGDWIAAGFLVTMAFIGIYNSVEWLLHRIPGLIK